MFLMTMLTNQNEGAVLTVSPKEPEEGITVSMNIVDNEESFEKLEEEWNRLAGKAGVPVYMTHEWIYSWWKHFGRHPKRKPFIVTVRLDSVLIGIFPFYLGVSSVGPLILQRRLGLMGSGVSHNELLGFTDDYGYSDFLDIIAHPDYRKTVCKSLIEFLERNPSKADTIRLQHIRSDSFVMKEVLPVLQNTTRIYSLVQTDECPYIVLPDTLEDYKEQLGSSSRRRRFRKNLKPVDKKYPVEKATSRESVEQGLEKLYRLHQNRWNSLGYPGAFFDIRHYEFLKEMSRKAFHKGWLWFQMGWDDRGVCVARMALNYQGRFYDWMSAFNMDSPVSKYSPGLGLLALMIKEAIEDGACRIELLRGAERYKFDFTSSSQYNWRLVLYPKGRDSLLRRILNGILGWTSAVYSQLQKEWKLIQVHRQEAGIVKSLYSYAAFRTERLKEKLKESGWYPAKSD